VDDVSAASNSLSHFLEEQVTAVERLELQVDSLTSVCGFFFFFV
jgi:hypothetical protein